MKKVFLGVGHGGSDPGAVGYLREEDVNLNMALACRDYLEAHGVEVRMSRITDENDTLNEEIRECNEFNPDLAADMHNNSGGGDGFEVFYSIDGTGKTLAENIEKEVIAIGQNSRGCKTRLNSKGNADYYGFIRLTKCKSVILEGVFVDNKADAEQADTLEEQKAFGVAYAKGILKELGIDINKNLQTTKSIVDLAQAVIRGEYGTGEARKKALGSLYEEVQAKVNEIYAEMKKEKTILKTLARNTNLRNAPTVKGTNATLYLANTTLYVLEEAVANADGYVWDKVRIRVNGKIGYMINKNYK